MCRPIGFEAGPHRNIDFNREHVHNITNSI
jgi:hypothetical protein